MTCKPMSALSLGNDDADWTSVSSRQPCPICGSSSSCLVHGDGAFASCSQRQSEWPLTTGAWLHRLQSEHVVDALIPAVAALSIGCVL
jgi:hypothetical protein